MQRRKFLRVASCAAALSTFSPQSSAAGVFSLYPTRLDFNARSTAGSVKIENSGQELGVFQIEARVWTSEGVDQATRDLIINPLIATILPNRSQTLRIALNNYVPSDVERTYRIFIEQISVASGNRFSTGSEVLLRFGIPVFVEPVKRRTAKLQISVHRSIEHADRLRVTVHNPANHHQRLLQVLWSTTMNRELAAVENRPVYVLAGSDAEFFIHGNSKEAIESPGKLYIKTETDQFQIDI